MNEEQVKSVDNNNDTYMVFDLETTIRCPIGSNKASPFWKNVANENIICYEARKSGNTPYGVVANSMTRRFVSEETTFWEVDQHKLIVGVNLSFDAQHKLSVNYSASYPEEHNYIKVIEQANWWDTQLAAYLLSAQQHAYPSLDELSIQYGLPVKDNKIKEYWANGIDTPDIPEEEIVPYALQDVINTEQIFLKQYVEVKAAGMLPLVKSQMAALKTTTFMSYNGMYIDKAKLWDNKDKLKLCVADLEDQLKYLMSETDYPDCDYNSNKQLANLLFGGTIKYKEKELVGKYKNGKDHYQLVSKERVVKGLNYICTTTSPAGNRVVDDDALQYLVDTFGGVHHATDSIPSLVLQLRALNKQISTYYEGIENLIMPDGMIHQSINHAVTKTGRTSCTQPNLQNITNGNIKQVFTSRFGDDGVIIDIDFSQLEIVALAYLSQDKQLMQDITYGLDIHTELFKSMYGGVEPTSQQRKAFKRLAFGLIYGAGYKSLAKNAGVGDSTAKAFVKAFYERYPGVDAFHKATEATVRANRTKSDFKDEDGFPVGQSLYTAVTGRRLLFKEYKLSEAVRSWKKGKTHDFSYTEMCNYPVQSLATGDLVTHALGMLGRKIIGNPMFDGRCLMVNTVHDSIMFDCKKEALPECLKEIMLVLNELKNDFDRTFSINFGLPIRYNVSIGPSWADAKELTKKELDFIIEGA